MPIKSRSLHFEWTHRSFYQSFIEIYSFNLFIYRNKLFDDGSVRMRMDREEWGREMVGEGILSRETF